uniref:Uncharacterized protein n=1 Tax=Rhizophora mucronata TaxID=61149 RepID=A0A2P2NU01_RHIMU
MFCFFCVPIFSAFIPHTSRASSVCIMGVLHHPMGWLDGIVTFGWDDNTSPY